MRALRYRQERDSGEREESPAGASDAHLSPATRQERAAYVETLIDQAIRAGEFDDLPGAGKPLPGLGGVHDPDWWIRRKIEREQLGGLGPPALTLRTESTGLEARLDALHREDEVRETLSDFNRRVIEARRQLLGGPPVVTPTRDIDAEVRAWRERRRDRAARASDAETSGTRRERRRARRRAARPPSLDG